MLTKKSVSTMRFTSYDAMKSLDPISCIFYALMRYVGERKALILRHFRSTLV